MNISPNPELTALLQSMPDVEHLNVFLHEAVDEETAIDLLWHSLPALQTVHIAKRYNGELPSTWIPIPTLHAAIDQVANGGERIRKLTCSSISSIPGARPFYGLGWEPGDVVGDSRFRVMDFVDDLVLDCMNCDKELLDQPKLQCWDRRETVF
ncbi:hypothetical protein FOMPIDRAFT_116246 [Fomitopsis schrenkii]|uniref:Uncharacterized protein n=1 Tax=Fomitopsis schrenkii TaxID=2126942 RepID=S8FK59_FOMSC|nr:hypothetical protein FOMPIDRAFT_116246 [Fomitopsis schrenkii]